MTTFQPKVKLYLDGADKAAIEATVGDSLIQGYTTNPSLMKKAGVTDYKGYSLELLKVLKGKPVSFEVFDDEPSEMRRQAHEIKSWGPNVYVKIPVMNSKGQNCYDLVKELSQGGVKLNVTALFTVEQVVRVCEGLKGGAPSIVSVFAGRIADTGRDPEAIMSASAQVCEAYGSQIELLWASNREFLNIHQAERTGCKIITITPDVYKKRSMYMKPLLDMSLDTVQTFKKDSDAAGFKL